MLRSSRHVGGALLMALWLGTSSSALASTTSFRWNECTVWKDLFLAPTTALENSYLYRMRVMASGVRTTCPVPTDGGTVSSADVYVENRPGGAISCCMSVLSEWGTTVATSSCANTTATGKVKLTLVVSTPVSMPFGTAYIQCTLPPNAGDTTSGIIGYSVYSL